MSGTAATPVLIERTVRGSFTLGKNQVLANRQATTLDVTEIGACKPDAEDSRRVLQPFSGTLQNPPLSVTGILDTFTGLVKIEKAATKVS